MAHKHWKAWMKIVCTVVLLATSIADFTTECQRPCDCRWQSGNKAAICSNSSLKSVPTNLSSDIQILDLSNNNLFTLHQEAFKKVGLSNLKKLFIKECNIDVVHKTAFASLAIMIELDLSRNRIRNLHPDLFKGTEKLRLINLSNNLIDKLEDGVFRNLKYLQKVEVSNNMIVRIGSKAFVNLPQLKILRFDGNSLSHMKPESLMALHNLSGLDLHNNPWRCDCNLQTFRDWVITNNLYTPPTACAEPAAVKDKLWTELNSSNFACRPTVLEPAPDARLKSYDENVTLVCKVVGNPTPEVIWRYNGRVIETRSYGEIRYVTNENTMDLIKWVNLTIVNVRYSDKGNYTCVAQNPGGRDEKTLTLVLSRYGSPGTILGLDTDTFVILVGCLTTLILICVSVLGVCYFMTQNNDSKRLIKADTSSNGDILTENSITSELEKGLKVEVNPVTKPPRKYEPPASLTSEATEMSELNRTLLDNESILASMEDNSRHHEVELSKISQEALLLDRLTQEHQTYPPDLLTFPLRGGTQVSPASGSSQDRKTLNESPAKSPGYEVTVIPHGYRFHMPSTSQASMHTKGGYVTLPRRPRGNWFPENSRPQVFSTLNGVTPYYDHFNMKLFNNGANYYGLNKSDMDLGPTNKHRAGYNESSEEIEPAPSPAPGTPHAAMPRSSLSSPNIHNQLLAFQAMSYNALQGRIMKPSEQRPLKVLLAENESLLKNQARDLRVGVSVNNLNRTRTAPKPPPKPRKKGSSELKEPFLFINTGDTATQV